ncbi:MAG: helix-turn-helix domain-containing protein [Clostridia bacterium]|nr:helix-turn-helix domain-containing protein [Clostridia bacterium]
MIDTIYLQLLLSKYREEQVRIYITDMSTRIIAATEEERIGSSGTTAAYILRIRHAAIIDNPGEEDGRNDVTTYGVPYMEGGEVAGAIIVHAPGQRSAEIGSYLHKAIEASSEYKAYQNKLEENPRSERYRIGRMLLSEEPDNEVLADLMNRNELDPELLRSVIVIRLAYLRPSYFNINLNLGYQSSYEMLRQEAEAQVRACRSLNSQDLVFFLNRGFLVVIKAFHPTNSDSTRLYLTMDRVCKDLAEILRRFTSFSFHIAYGNLYEGIGSLHMSLQEAVDILDVGMRCSNSEIYSLNDLLFENVYLRLHPQIIHKLIRPAIEKMRSDDRLQYQSLIETAEAFISSGFRLSETAERTGLHRNTISTRLEKLRILTGLDVTSGFDDAFLLKMLAVYLRLSESGEGSVS